MLRSRHEVRMASQVPRSGEAPSSAGVRGLDRVDLHQRSQCVQAHLAELRAPLTGIELTTRDHAVLTWLADQDLSTVEAVVSLLVRARSCGHQDQR
ncbi:hypothetical protein [Bounagaea algeriensis]